MYIAEQISSRKKISYVSSTKDLSTLELSKVKDVSVKINAVTPALTPGPTEKSK